jgi:long-chain acyl-CoA synthetase
VPDKKTKDEHIEALVYPSPDFFTIPDASSGMVLSKEQITERIERIITEVNQRLLPYQKIARTVILEERMEETTTKKIKRDAV